MEPNEITEEWRKKLIGQNHVIEAVVPYVTKFLVNLHRPDHPVGNFLFLGPTGTGKTKSMEALAEVLHGNANNILRVDCGEFQMEHDIAKLIGAPPGYLGHRETHPMLSQTKINAVSSENCDLSIVLFDEIEKAAPSMWRLLLGILDKANMKLGDNTNVKFDRCIIAMTANIGQEEMQRMLRPTLGFETATRNVVPEDFIGEKGLASLQKMGTSAFHRKFPAEFPNRLDSVVTFRPLPHDVLVTITQNELTRLQNHIDDRLQDKGFTLSYTPEVVEYLVKTGSSIKFGAREINRVIDRELYNPITFDFATQKIVAGDTVDISLTNNKLTWVPVPRSVVSASGK